MNIHDALVQLAKYEEQIGITDPAGSPIGAIAYPWFGPKETVESPAFLNFWSFNGERRGPGGYRILAYSILIQLFVGPADADSDYYAECCALFQNAVVDKFSEHVVLGETVSVTRLRGLAGEYQPIDLIWNEEHYTGLQFLLDCDIHEAAPAIGA